MDVKKAKQVIETEHTRVRDLKEAPRILETEKRKQLIEKQKEEDKKRKDKFEAMKKRFPKNVNEVFTFCWKCGEKASLNNTERVANNKYVFRISECKSCSSFNVDKIDCTPKAGLDYEAFVRGLSKG